MGVTVVTTVGASTGAMGSTIGAVNGTMGVVIIGVAVWKTAGPPLIWISPVWNPEDMGRVEGRAEVTVGIADVAVVVVGTPPSSTVVVTLTFSI